MGKYDFDLNLDTINSLSIIVKSIKKDSYVLEMGPANGRLTKYLHETLNCVVDIVEIDEKSGNDAKIYASQACIGNIKGDLENNEWYKELSGNKYDYIIFADVLEHLRMPNKVLVKCLTLLKLEGSILVSIPNIAHNSIIISLLNGKFDYTELGILDNTHVHFFTCESFVAMVKRIGYSVEEIDSVISPVGENEILANYNMVSRSIARELKIRTDGEIYQYIFKLKKYNKSINKSIVINDRPKYNIECFININENVDFCDTKMIFKTFSPCKDKVNIIHFDLSMFAQIDNIRIDPINTNCIIKIEHINLNYMDETIDCKYSTNGNALRNSIYIFDTNDPQIYLNVPKKNPISVNIVYKIMCFDDENINVILKMLEDNSSLADEDSKRNFFYKLVHRFIN